MWEWCSRCGNPNPYAWFKRLRLTGVMLVLGVAVLLAFLAYQRTNSLGLAEQEFRDGASRGVLFVRRAGM